MATRVAGKEYYKIDGQLMEIKRQLRQKGGYPYDQELLSKALQDCIEGRFENEHSLIHGLFTPVEVQISRIRELNIEHDWGFTDKDFTLIEQSVPTWPNDRLIAVTLVPYLPDGDGMSGVERTFQELWRVAVSLQYVNYLWDGYDKIGSNTLCLLAGIEHPVKGKPILCWEVINLGCYRNYMPEEVRDPDSSPHAGILAAAALHPEWIKAMDGDKVPYVWVPGYEVNIPGEDPGQIVPVLTFNRDYRKIRFGVDRHVYCYSDRSVPSFAQESLGPR